MTVVQLPWMPHRLPPLPTPPEFSFKTPLVRQTHTEARAPAVLAIELVPQSEPDCQCHHITLCLFSSTNPRLPILGSICHGSYSGFLHMVKEHPTKLMFGLKQWLFFQYKGKNVCEWDISDTIQSQSAYREKQSDFFMALCRWHFKLPALYLFVSIHFAWLLRKNLCKSI